MSTANPQFDLPWIERVVREVIRRLTESDARTKAIADAGGPPKLAEAGECRLPERVISLETIVGKLEGITVLRLPAKAVVTPAARDELRLRKVAIRFDLEPQPNNLSGKQLTIGVTDELTRKDIASQLKATGLQADLQHDERVSRLVTKLGGRVSALRRCLVITSEPYTAVCVANRNANVRAAIVRGDAELRMAKVELNPNFLVLPVERLMFLPVNVLVESLMN